MTQDSFSPSPYIYQQQAGTAPTQVATPLAPANQGQNEGVYLDKHQRIKRTCTHTFALALNLVTCGAAFNIALGQVLGMAMQRLGWVEWLVRIYEMVFSGVVIMNELQWTSVIRESPVLSLYMYRGILYMFIGILGVMMNDVGMNANRQQSSQQWNSYGSYSNNNITIYIPTQEQALELYIQIVSWSMVGFGFLYMTMGLARQEEKCNDMWKSTSCDCLMLDKVKVTSKRNRVFVEFWHD